VTRGVGAIGSEPAKTAETMQIAILVAAAENGVIGADGGIPWRLPDDQKHFKALTLGHSLVMGRRTYESIGRLLPDRTTIVVSGDRALAIDGAHVVGSLEEAFALARRAGETDLFVVGGERVYRDALPFANRIHLTRVHTDIGGDTRFPGADELERAGFRLVEQRPHPRDARHDHAFTFEQWARGD